MMDTDTRAEQARTLYRALAAGDRPAVEGLLAPDFVGRTAAGLPLGLGGTYRGREAMIRDFWWRLGASFAANAHAESFAAADDGRLQVIGTYRGAARATGRSLEAAFVHVLGFDGGRISSLDQFTDTALWRDATVALPPHAGPSVDRLETIDYRVEGGIAHIRLNRPENRNAVNLQLAEETLAVARAVAADPTVRAVLIQGNGPWLSAGGDLDYFREWPDDSFPALLTRMTEPFHEALRIFSTVEAPIVTAAHGMTVGGGLLYVFAADIVLAAQDATFSTVFSGIGLSGDGGGTWYLPRLVGAARARRMYLENLRLDADTALEWGLVAHVVPSAELAARAGALAAQLADGPTRGFAAQRRLLHDSWTTSLADQLRAETAALHLLGGTGDAVGAIAAFTEKRRPHFEGR